MFGKKKQDSHRVTKIIILDESGREIIRKDIREYELEEDSIIVLSKEYFNDPEPCEIHRGAVHKRAVLEMQELSADANTVLKTSLTPLQQHFLPKGAYAFYIER